MRRILALLLSLCLLLTACGGGPSTTPNTTKPIENLELPMDVSQADAIAAVKADPVGQKWLDGKEPKRVIFVPKKIITVVI